jgi:HK97 family phage portal protein
MPIVVSESNLINMPANWWPTGGQGGSITLYDQHSYEYAKLYKTQPNVRTCVDFLARNIAQLGLHVFRREGDDNRVRLRDHPLASVINRPLPADFKVTRYRLIESLISDMGIWFNAYWLKIKVKDGPLGLLRLPPQFVTVYGGLVPERYEFSYGGMLKKYTPQTVVHIRGYNSESNVFGLSPMETLRRILAEEFAAGDYREHFWRNSARMGGVIERPLAAPNWEPKAMQRFKAEFEALYSGGENSGKTAILEEGMTWKTSTFNPKDSEYLEGRRLTREECARAYHIPPPLVGILDRATFNNIAEQHKMLYTDVLGPWLTMVEQDVDLQLLPEFDDTDGVYVEFNIAEKLQGDFEQQSKSLQSAIGRPWMTANEGRAVMNLPRLDDPGADELVTPLNVLMGAQASPRDSAPKEKGIKEIKLAAANSNQPEMFEAHRLKWTEALARHYRRQEKAILAKLPAELGKTDIGGVWWDDERWNAELYEDILRLNIMTAVAWAKYIALLFGVELSEEWMMPWLKEHAQRQAVYINEYTRDEVQKAIADPEPLEAVKRVFLLAGSVWAVRQAITAVTSASSFGAYEGAKAAKLKTKTWRVNSTNPRDAHLAMDGETVGIRERFSNGMRWPGDPSGGAENNANCNCSLEFSL